MERAVDRIFAAIDRGERIVLYGDYDVDGVTSLALISRVLAAYGSEPATFLPHRVDEGYGLSPDGIARCVELPFFRLGRYRRSAIGVQTGSARTLKSHDC